MNAHTLQWNLTELNLSTAREQQVRSILDSTIADHQDHGGPTELIITGSIHRDKIGALWIELTTPDNSAQWHTDQRPDINSDYWRTTSAPTSQTIPQALSRAQR